jgi:hypothetical protein
MEYPTIVSIKVNGEFMYLWLKYVVGYNLDVHCAKCLIGKYSKAISSSIKVVEALQLTEHYAKAYYLCGVSKPYKYNKNFHLAFKFKEGSNIEVNSNGIKIYIKNAEQITITKLDNYNHLNGNDSKFNTCRNWQFAYIEASK